MEYTKGMMLSSLLRPMVVVENGRDSVHSLGPIDKASYPPCARHASQ
jgi:hypothetical protein